MLTALFDIFSEVAPRGTKRKSCAGTPEGQLELEGQLEVQLEET
jgi:hypothetical protein